MPGDGGAPTIAIVAMAHSVHTARWVAMIRGAWIRIVVIPVMPEMAFANLAPDRTIASADDLAQLRAGEVGVFDFNDQDWKFAKAVDQCAGFVRESHPAFPPHSRLATAHHVTTAIRLIDPDLVHSMEIQIAGYLTLEARRRLSSAFPPWLLSNWGSDVMLFQKLPGHRTQLASIFEHIDGYWSECHRDVGIARHLGYMGRVFDPVPASGGMSLENLPKVEQPPSRRRKILIKGYHGWAGRGMHILSAIYMAAEALRGYKILISFPSEGMTEMVRSISSHTGLDMAIVPHLPAHYDALVRLSECRMAIGLGISDGITTTLLEAMSVGTFPILADSSCACEWVTHERDAMIVGPHDVAGLAAAISRAARDDDLVDRAAPRNQREVRTRWDPDVNGRTALANYRSMIEASRLGAGSVWRRPVPLPVDG
jgi:hypothetical protein